MNKKYRADSSDSVRGQSAEAAADTLSLLESVRPPVRPADLCANSMNVAHRFSTEKSQVRQDLVGEIVRPGLPRQGVRQPKNVDGTDPVSRISTSRRPARQRRPRCLYLSMVAGFCFVCGVRLDGVHSPDGQTGMWCRQHCPACAAKN
jgi:hypothetical protein